MLERLAELVRKEAEAVGAGNHRIPCFDCEKALPQGMCAGAACPKINTNEGSLMFARKVVLLVAKALEPQIDKWLEHIKGVPDGLMESDLLASVAHKLLTLISEASSNGCKSEK